MHGWTNEWLLWFQLHLVQISGYATFSIWIRKIPFYICLILLPWEGWFHLTLKKDLRRPSSKKSKSNCQNIYNLYISIKNALSFFCLYHFLLLANLSVRQLINFFRCLSCARYCWGWGNPEMTQTASLLFSTLSSKLKDNQLII